MHTIPAVQLAEILVDVADILVDEFDLVEFMERVTAHTADFSHNEAVAIMLVDHEDRLQFMAATQESAKMMELFQIQNDEGPCRDCIREGVPVVNANLEEASDRWPLFAPRAVEAGFRSVHAFPLRHRRNIIGALNLFGTEVGPLDPDDVRVVQALADVATIALLQEHTIHRGEVLIEQLQTALNRRATIEQAKGAIAQLRGVGVDAAYALLREYCRAHHEHLGRVAYSVLTDPTSHPDLTNP